MKLSKVVKQGSTPVSRMVVAKRKSRYLIIGNYVKGGIEYHNSKLLAIYHAEGRVAFTDATQSLSITAPINGETKSFKTGTIIADNTNTGSANVTMQASTNIQFLPGFFIEQGTAFNANIVSAAATSKAYEYVIRDHLGNGCIYFTDYNGNGSIEESNGEILQVGVKRKSRYAVIGKAHYDPWGYALGGNWVNNPGVDNLYQYNGKELNNDFGLGLYDYNLRNFDPSIGKLTTIDPLSEKFSSYTPYNYVQNNPVRYIDRLGLYKIDPYFAKKYPGLVQLVTYVLPQLANNSKVKEAWIAETGGSASDFIEMITPGSGPWITPTQDGHGILHDAYHTKQTRFGTVRGDKVDNTDNIFPDPEDALDSYESSFKESMLKCDPSCMTEDMFVLSMHILHESAHYGVNKYGGNGNPRDIHNGGNERGIRFQYNAFGTDFLNKNGNRDDAAAKRFAFIHMIQNIVNGLLTTNVDQLNNEEINKVIYKDPNQSNN